MSQVTARSGVTLGVQNGLQVAQLPEVAREAERLGYAELWSEEAAALDAVTGLAAAAAVTDTIALGTGIVPVFGRAPSVVAMEAAGVQALSAGRFRLGLGASTATIAERWRGERYQRPITRLFEYVSVIRRILAGEKVTHHGEVRLEGFRLMLPQPLPPVPPIYVAALGERALALSAQHADGVVLGNLTPRGVRQSVHILRTSADAAGREPIDVVGRVSVLLDDDLERGRAYVGRLAAFYLSSDVYRRSLGRQGFSEEVEQFAQLWDGGQRARAVAGLSDELLMSFAVFGDESAVRRSISEFRAAGLDAPLLYPIVIRNGSLSDAQALERVVSVLGTLRGV